MTGTRIVERLDAELDLRDDQAARLREILSAQAAELRPHVAYIRDQPDRRARIAALRERRGEIQRIRAETDAQIQPVLTAQQYTRYLELRAELRRELRERLDTAG